MSHNVRKCVFEHMQPVKTRISLHICAVWSAFVVCQKKPWILGPIKCLEVQADLSLCWEQMSEGTVSHATAHV